MGFLPMESLAHNSGRTLFSTEYGYANGLQIPTGKEEIGCYRSQYIARLGADQMT
jgi:hypothetical protein